MNALAAQLQSAFAMLGGAGSMFTERSDRCRVGVNWEVTKDTARKTVASLGPDPSPRRGAAACHYRSSVARRDLASTRRPDSRG